MSYQHLKITRAAAVATVTLNRPDKANALNFELLCELEQAALSFRDDDATRVVIVTGAGRNFCGGFDLTDPGAAYQGSMTLRRRRNRIGARVIAALLGIDAITLAAWRGAAMGGGACIATCLDFRVAADSARIGFPEVDLGMNLMWQALPICVAMTGPARAKRLVAGGEQLDADQMLAWGLADWRCADADLAAITADRAAFYAAKPPAAAQMIKQSVNQLAYAQGQAMMHMDADQNLLARTTKDASEAVAAYREKRPPRFSGD